MPLLTIQQAQRDAEGTRDGNEAVSVTSDKSHEGKGAVSETEAQDGPVDEVTLPLHLDA